MTPWFTARQGTLVFLFFASVVAPTKAALLDYDSFSYSGTDLHGQAGGTGWNAGWFATTATTNNLSNDEVSLSCPASFESPLVGITSSGSRVKTEGLAANATNSRLLSQTIPLNVDGTVRYASALIRKNRANGVTINDNILIEFVDASANRRWGFGIEGNGDKPWLNANGSTTPSGGPAVTVGDTYFIVAKIVASSSSMDTAYLKVFGTGYGSVVPASEPTTWDATLTETTAATLDRVRIRIDSANTAGLPGEVDEIRIADTWQDVVGGATSQPVLTISRSSSDFILSWPTNSTGYSLQRTDSLDSISWAPVGTEPVVDGTNNVVTVSNVGGAGFFRLQK